MTGREYLGTLVHDDGNHLSTMHHAETPAGEGSWLLEAEARRDPERRVGMVLESAVLWGEAGAIVVIVPDHARRRVATDIYHAINAPEPLPSVILGLLPLAALILALVVFLSVVGLLLLMRGGV